MGDETAAADLSPLLRRQFGRRSRENAPTAIRVAGAAARRARSRYDVRAAAARPSSLSASFR